MAQRCPEWLFKRQQRNPELDATPSEPAGPFDEPTFGPELQGTAPWLRATALSVDGGSALVYRVDTQLAAQVDDCAIVALAAGGNHVVLEPLPGPGSVVLRTQQFPNGATPPTFVDVDSGFSLIVICAPN